MTDSLLHLAKKHYENFPVGSRLIPKKYREPIHLIYAFARVADDIADEGNLNPEERIVRLNEWENLLLQSVKGEPVNEFFEKLVQAMKRHNLPVQYFQDLMTAFRRDSLNPIYSTFEEVLEYCQYSANPIGRLLLIIFNCSNAENEVLSDRICTALQLTNFWQDISVDTRRNRFYIPATELQQFGLMYQDLSRSNKKKGFHQLMKFQVERTRKLFEEGKPLIVKVNKEFKKELACIWLGGTKILEKIEMVNYDTRSVRPVVTKLDMVFLLLKAIRY